MAYISFQPNDYFNTKLYTGTGSAQSISSVGFQPDWVWVKDRDSANSHNLTDAVRGVTKTIFSDANAGEVTDAQRLTSFDSDGFSVGTSTSFNTNTNDYVSWNWKANGQGSSNTDGSINTTYTSADTTSGFSISTYTGTGSNATVGHGLGAVPKVVLVKGLGHTSQWYMYHIGTGAGKVMFLDNTAAQTTDTTSWQNTTPTSSVFSIGNDGGTNGSSNTYVAYCFAEKQGFSKFGSYTGNASTDGPFVYCGFKPAWFLVKKSSAAGEDWGLYDNKRNTFNEVDEALFPSATTAETNVGDGLDFCSNGVKIRDSGGELNTSAATYIFMAFAEAPLVSSNGVPAVAR